LRQPSFFLGFGVVAANLVGGAGLAAAVFASGTLSFMPSLSFADRARLMPFTRSAIDM
jgi:hypothetical protein